ncbi:SCO family protein [Sphingobacterium sp. N143]|uniref:SCO family protein n=1 Tax=Sphingobacterium sp. N143 TaxID=2746727 RepID=UPI002576D3AF|nr:SCO family protein [Sphingobacterium sp. N143]MDM1294981.1 SCO family protein [Sphingobacterium sp. N143]
MSNNTGQKKGIKKVIVLVVILLLPGFLYFILNKSGSNSYASLPIFGKKEVPGTTHRKWGRDIPDTIYHTVSPVDFVNYDGKPVHLLDNDTTLSVVHLMYSKDVSLSRTMVKKLDQIAIRFIQNKKVKLYSITVDTAFDTPEVLAQYAKVYKPWTKSWFFVTDPSVDIFTFAKESLLQDAHVNKDGRKPFIISSNYLLLDTKGRIRGVYDINAKTDVDRLEDEIKLLLVEEIRNHPATIEQKR